jgi:hypothetical protein
MTTTTCFPGTSVFILINAKADINKATMMTEDPTKLTGFINAK